MLEQEAYLPVDGEICLVRPVETIRPAVVDPVVGDAPTVAPGAAHCSPC